MECSCTMDVDMDGDAPSCVRQKIVQAVKPHICGECGRIIKIAEQYEYHTAIWDGKFDVDKTCSDCLSLREEFFHGWCFTVLWRDFKRNMYDCGWQVPERCLAKVTPAARERICELIENYWKKEK